MADRYSGEWDSSHNGNNHIVSETRNGEYYYCKCEGCKVGIRKKFKGRKLSLEEAEEKLNELNCPISEQENEDIANVAHFEFTFPR